MKTYTLFLAGLPCLCLHFFKNPVDMQRPYFLSQKILLNIPVLEIVCAGVTGHASLLPDDLAADKIRYVINKFLDFRDSEKKRLLENSKLTIGDVTSVNLVSLEVRNLLNKFRFLQRKSF